ncbi:MAG: hypothetical protein ACI4J0_07615 [Huintestinicola sp.]|uniref:hypothetical protein n=1 Tax=Huintestinicola sp. TaxID=2981661 RepID=UPI003F080399
MKKYITIIALATVMTALTGCGGEVSSPTDTVTSNQSSEEAVFSEETQVTELSASDTSITSEVISETQETTLAEEPTSVNDTENEYNDTNSAVSENEPQIRVEWADEADLTAGYDEYDIFEPSEEQAKVAFISDTPVNEFVILELTLTDCSDEGVMTFSAYPAASPDITPGKPLVIGFTFAGDIPGYGFQYEDADGNIRRFALEISGEDGSLVIREASGEYYDFVLE